MALSLLLISETAFLISFVLLPASIPKSNEAQRKYIYSDKPAKVSNDMESYAKRAQINLISKIKQLRKECKIGSVELRVLNPNDPEDNAITFEAMCSTKRYGFPKWVQILLLRWMRKNDVVNRNKYGDSKNTVEKFNQLYHTELKMPRANEMSMEQAAEPGYPEFLELTQAKLDEKIRAEGRKLKEKNCFDVDRLITGQEIRTWKPWTKSWMQESWEGDINPPLDRFVGGSVVIASASKMVRNALASGVLNPTHGQIILEVFVGIVLEECLKASAITDIVQQTIESKSGERNTRDQPKLLRNSDRHFAYGERPDDYPRYPTSPRTPPTNGPHDSVLYNGYYTDSAIVTGHVYSHEQCSPSSTLRPTRKRKRSGDDISTTIPGKGLLECESSRSSNGILEQGGSPRLSASIAQLPASDEPLGLPQRVLSSGEDDGRNASPSSQNTLSVNSSASSILSSPSSLDRYDDRRINGLGPAVSPKDREPPAGVATFVDPVSTAARDCPRLSNRRRANAGHLNGNKVQHTSLMNRKVLQQKTNMQRNSRSQRYMQRAR